MCGIVGYIGNNDALPVLIEGLSKLEYRGYDSAGVAILKNEGIHVQKQSGRLANLSDNLCYDTLKSNIGIGHTRWATHGEPTDYNSHPHTNQTSSIAVIHNGIIENYMKLKDWLIDTKGSTFKSDTDSEVIAHLVDHHYEGDLLDAVYKAVGMMEGAYAIAVIADDNPEFINKELREIILI